jgi:uncharacterized protein (DUF2267 family)
MSDPVTKNINASVQKTFEWLADVETALETIDRQGAYHALRSVLQALRDRLEVEEAVNLAEQLPTLLRGIYYEGWSPAHKPDKMNKKEFLDRVKLHAAAWPGDTDPERCVAAVFSVLEKRISAGEISDVRGALPKAFDELWAARGTVG